MKTRRLPTATTTLAVSVALALAGCATPALQPAVELPGRYSTAPASEQEPEVAWWEAFGDPVLNRLVRQAANSNRDVRIAAERVRAARASTSVSRSWLMPSIGITASGIDQSTGYGDPVKKELPDARTASGGLAVSWEIDIAGRLRAGASAAEADALAAEHAARGVRLLVVSDVAANYFTLVGALQQLETVRAIADAQDQTLRLVSARQRAGLATPFDVERAQTEAARARAAIPPLETLAAVSRHRIAVLIGDQAGNAGSIVPWSGEAQVPAAHAGQPATLLERRPDLLALRAQLEAANWRRQQAAAEWFPRLVLNAVFGREGMELNTVDLSVARFSNVSALLTMPIFNAGRTQAINDIAESAQVEALVRFEDGIVRALEDVENTLVALHDDRQRAESLRIAATSADAALGRARSLYERGQIDLLPLLDAQRTRLVVRLGANDADTQVRLDAVRLFKSLGGGWQVFEPAEQPAAAAKRAPNA